MKKQALVVLLAALSLVAGPSAFAQRDGKRDEPRDERAGAEHRQDDNRGRGERPGERGAGPQHNFRKGDRLPAQYRSKQYVVNDWRGRHLTAPPRGYHWVQTGGDYVLVAIATGVIASILLNQ